MLLAQCPVCQECFTNALECNISALPCGHVFHQICIDTWFKTSSTCPQCRIGIKKTFVISKLYFDMISYSSEEQPVNSSTFEQETSASESSVSLFNRKIYTSTQLYYILSYKQSAVQYNLDQQLCRTSSRVFNSLCYLLSKKAMAYSVDFIVSNKIRR